MTGLFRLLAVLGTLTGAARLDAADWPQWMGPTRDGVWAEGGILARFPAGGPKKLWARPVELGYAGPAVAGGRVYVPDYVTPDGAVTPTPFKRDALAGKERVLCLDAATGERVWEHKYDCPYDVSYPAGPRCTPTVGGGKVYALGTMGHLWCLDAGTGAVVWKKHLPTDYKARVPNWGFAGHPLVYENLLVCLVGGPGALVVAFDKDTGKEVWRSLSESDPGYCPPTLIAVGGKPQIVLATPTMVVGLNPADGTKLWDVPFKPHYAMTIAAPRPAGDALFVGAYGDAVLLKPAADPPGAAVVWRGKRQTAVYPSNATPLVEGGVVYGVDAGTGGLRAVKLATGERLWERTEPVTGGANQPALHGTAFLVRNRDRYFLFNERGELVIARLSPEKYEEIDRAKLVEPTGTAFGRPVVWSHPAFAGKCVFVRNDKELACFSLAE